MCDRIHILTVGTSLTANTGGKGRERCASIKHLNEACVDATDALTCDGAVDDQACGLRGELADWLSPGTVEAELRHRTEPEPGKSDRLPQELSYLAIVARDADGATKEGTADCNEKQPLGEVALLASDTLEGKLCAEVIRLVLADSNRGYPWCRFKLIDCDPLRVVRGLTTAPVAKAHESFEKEGVPNLIAVLQELAADKWSCIDINFTGGFKGAIPFTTLAAPFLARQDDRPDKPAKHIELHYLFETTDRIIRLPVYPVGIDFPLWHREANLLRAAEVHPAYRKALDDRMSSVVSLPRGIPQVLNQQYESQMAHDPLQYYSERVVCQFLQPGDLRNRLLDLVRAIGLSIWTGDKLPMAADHAAKHHHNLLELAQLFLTPIMDEGDAAGRPFLTQEERFVLLAALLLHDSGHSIDALPVAGSGAMVPLFRSEVRDYHNGLSFHRLTTGHPDRDLRWDPDLPLARAVAWLCVYHRKRTQWDGGWGADAVSKLKAGANWIPYLDLKIPPPAWKWEHEKIDLFPNGEPPPLGFDFLRLVALIRLIDGCDNQSRRVGAGDASRLSEEWIERDGRTWRARLDALLTLMPASSDTPADLLRQMADAMAAEATASGSGAMQYPWKDWWERFWRLRIELGQKLASTGPSSKDVLWLEAARAFDECKIRGRQGAHFLKHRAVRWVRVEPQKLNNATWSFRVILVPETDLATVKDGEGNLLIKSGVYAQQNRDAFTQATAQEWILKEIADEVTPASLAHLSAASGRSVEIAFQWDGEPGTCILKTKVGVVTCE
jgi:hypothetical protein